MGRCDYSQNQIQIGILIEKEKTSMYNYQKIEVLQINKYLNILQ